MSLMDDFSQPRVTIVSAIEKENVGLFVKDESFFWACNHLPKSCRAGYRRPGEMYHINLAITIKPKHVALSGFVW